MLGSGGRGVCVCVCVCVWPGRDQEIFLCGGNERSRGEGIFKFKIKDTSRGEKSRAPLEHFWQLSSSQRTKQAAIPLWPFLDTHFNEMSKMGDNCITHTKSRVNCVYDRVLLRLHTIHTICTSETKGIIIHRSFCGAVRNVPTPPHLCGVGGLPVASHLSAPGQRLGLAVWRRHLRESLKTGPWGLRRPTWFDWRRPKIRGNIWLDPKKDPCLTRTHGR